MRTLVILEQGLSINHTELADKLHVDVTLNSYPMGDGVAIFTCGQSLGDGKWDPDTIIKVGTCEAYPGLPYNTRLDSDSDWEPDLYEILETGNTSDVEGPDMEEG